jgi:vacuolar-type H+-ATPase subunit E/Vma4
VLEQKGEFPRRTRNKIKELVENFLEELKDDIHELLCDNDADDYCGLNSNCDIEAEVETAIYKILSRSFIENKRNCMGCIRR